MEDLYGELRRLGLKGGIANTSMAKALEREQLKLASVSENVVTEPAKVEALKAIAQAYNAGQITGLQAAQLVRKI